MRRPAPVLAHRGDDGLGDVVAMDAAELVAGLDHPPSAAGAQIVEGGAAGTVDAGEAEDVHGVSVGEVAQRVPASRRRWPRGCEGAGGVSSSTQAPPRSP